MRNCLIIDVETTGLDPAVDRVIEVGVVLYSVTHGTVLESFSSLLVGEGNAAEAINRIPEAALADGRDFDDAWMHVNALAADAGAIVAHSAEFDRSFSPIALRTQLPWVCSKNDIAWPRQQQPGQSLVSLALAHDLGVAVAHRALADCDLIARLFTRSRELGADLGAMLTRAMRPKATFVALVPFERKDEAKAAGFTWAADRKQWLRTMAIEDAAALGFATRQVA